MRYLLVLLAMLYGCATPQTVMGTMCVADDPPVGYRVKNNQDGREGTIVQVHGRSDVCKQITHPVLVTVSYEW